MVLHGQTQSYHVVLTRDISEHDFGTFQTENYPYVVLLLNQTDVHQNENNPEYFTFHWVKIVLHVRISPERFAAQWFMKVMKSYLYMDFVEVVSSH